MKKTFKCTKCKKTFDIEDRAYWGAKSVCQRCWYSEKNKSGGKFRKPKNKQSKFISENEKYLLE